MRPDLQFLRLLPVLKAYHEIRNTTCTVHFGIGGFLILIRGLWRFVGLIPGIIGRGVRDSYAFALLVTPYI